MAGFEGAGMTLSRVLITAVVVENRSVPEVAVQYGVSRSWLYELLARYRREGEAAFEPRSRRPHTSKTALSADVVDLIVELREKLTTTGLDAGPDTIGWHLAHHHDVTVSRATVARYLAKRGLVTPEPKKRPKSSYIRFAAEMPNGCWQADFTHYRLIRPDGRPGADTEILSFIDDHPRFALRVTAHVRVTGPIVVAEFRKAVGTYGPPAATLTDNGMVFTTRLSGGKRGAGTRNGFEHELRKRGVTQRNSRPNHPTTCGKVERFQQTLKKWLAAQPDQPTTRRTGGTRWGRTRRLTAATGTLSCTSATRTPWPTLDGPENTWRPRLNGNTPRAVDWTAPPTHGGPSSCRAAR